MSVKSKSKRPYDYESVTKNVYRINYGTGNYYRVRVSISGTRHDEYFTSKNKALKHRNELLKQKAGR